MNANMNVDLYFVWERCCLQVRSPHNAGARRQAGVDKVKSLIKTNPEQASDAAGELLKGKNKKNVELVTSVARAYLDAGQLKEAETYLEMARKADNKAPAVSVLEGDIAFGPE